MPAITVKRKPKAKSIKNVAPKTATKTKAVKKAKPKKRSLADIKLECAQKGLEVAAEYDKRFRDTWLYTLGEDVEPVLRTAIVHKPKKAKKKLSWADLKATAKTK